VTESILIVETRNDRPKQIKFCLQRKHYQPHNEQDSLHAEESSFQITLIYPGNHLQEGTTTSYASETDLLNSADVIKNFIFGAFCNYR